MTKRKYEACHNLFIYRHQFLTALKPRLLSAKKDIQSKPKTAYKDRRKAVLDAFLGAIAEIEDKPLDPYGGVAVDTDLLSRLMSDCERCVKELEMESYSDIENDSTNLQRVINLTLYLAFLRILWPWYVASVCFQVLKGGFSGGHPSAE